MLAKGKWTIKIFYGKCTTCTYVKTDGIVFDILIDTSSAGHSGMSGEWATSSSSLPPLSFVFAAMYKI